MAPSIGLNLRVTGYKHQGGRRYMEDDFGVAYQQTADEKDLEYAFFGIFDGHGGREAAAFAKEHLMDYIVSQKGFWEEDDDSVLKAIREGYLQTHYAMWKDLEKWPKTASGLPSTAGTTASIAFIRRGKIYVGHVGDSAIVLGVQDPDNPDVWIADPLTIDHKPESIEESERITQSGGKVVCKSGVPRVVWNRPKVGHQGPVRRSTHIDEIPFLAVARSLGDLWSYNSEENVFVVSPEPDCRVYNVDITKHRCLILATDGAWNMMTPQNSVSVVCKAEKSNEQHMLNPVEGRTCWINPSKMLVDTAIERWINSKLRADNTSVVTVMLDPPGPPRAQVLKNRQRELAELNSGRDVAGPSGLQATAADRGSMALVTNTTPASVPAAASLEPLPVPVVSRSRPAATVAAGQPQPRAESASVLPSVPGPSSSSSSAAGSIIASSSRLVAAVASSGSTVERAVVPVVPGPGPAGPDTCTIISRFPNSSNPDYSTGYDLIKQRRYEDIVPGAAPGSSPQPPPPSARAASASLTNLAAGPVNSSPGGTRVGGSLRDDTIIRAGGASPASALSPAPSSSTRSAAASSSKAVTEDIVQCNEISSSEDSPGHSRAGQSTPPPPPGQENILPTSSSSKVVPPVQSPSKRLAGKGTPARKSLSKELNSLQAESRSTRSVKIASLIIPASRTTRGVVKSSTTTSLKLTKSPTKDNKMLQKPVLSKERTKSMVQMRCVEIIEKLEQAKSISTRSLSVNRSDILSVYKSSVVPEQSPVKASSLNLRGGRTPKAIGKLSTTTKKSPLKTPTSKAPVAKAKTPSTKAKVTIAIKTPRSARKNLRTPASGKTSTAKAKTPLRLRTPRTIDKKVAAKINTSARSSKVTKTLLGKLSEAPSSPKTKVVFTPKPAIAKKVTLAITPKSVKKQPTLSTPKSTKKVAKKSLTPKSVTKKESVTTTPKSAKAPMISRSSRKAADATPKSASKKLSEPSTKKSVDAVTKTPAKAAPKKSTPKSAAKNSKAVTATPRSSLKRKLTATEIVPEISSPAAKTPRKVAPAAAVVVAKKKPLITRSKQAVVLRLRKKN